MYATNSSAGGSRSRIGALAEIPFLSDGARITSISSAPDHEPLALKPRIVKTALAILPAAMLTKPVRYLKQLRSLHRLNFAMARAAATAQLRELDPASPDSWEFSGFSQHGEDGIIDYLTRRLQKPRGYFIEIGCANGLENNSTWLALGRSFSGLMVDGNREDLEWSQYILQPLNY